MSKMIGSIDCEDSNLLRCTLNIVLSYCEKNDILNVDEAVRLIYEIYAAVGGVRRGRAQYMPAVPIEESVCNDYIVCLEDGKRLKMLKRHLKTEYNMTPDEYKRKWHLPDNYPMVAAEYAMRRSNLARAAGLGKGKFHDKD